MKSFKLSAVALALAGLVAYPHPALAKRKKKAAKAPSAQASPDLTSPNLISMDPLEPKSVEIIQQRLDTIRKTNARKKVQKGTAKAAASLAQAFDALSKKNYAQARSLAKLAENDELFTDYAHWIEGSAYQADAFDSLEHDSDRDAGPFAHQAYLQFVTVQTGNPYSVLVHLAARQVAISELYWAQASPPSRDTVKHFQFAFERLNNLNAMIEIRPENVAHYATACHKFKSDLCESWIQKLASTLPRSSDEMVTVLKAYPHALERPKAPPSTPRATQTYKGTDLDLTAFEDAMTSVHDQKWGDAQTKLEKFLDEFPKSTFRFRVRYSLALVYLRNGKKDESAKTFQNIQTESPLTFYGLVSAIAQGKDFEANISKEAPLASERDADMAPEDLFRLNRAEILLSQGAAELASFELRGITSRPHYSNQFLMYLALLDYRAQNFPSSFQLLSELVQRGYPGVASQFGLKMIFPVAHLDLIKVYAKESGLDPLLVLSLIKQESAFDKKAFSPSGASGLMQLMPFTAVETVPGITREQLIEADSNIKVGTRYLAKLMDHFKGNAALAIAAYNSGPTAVERWVHEGSTDKRGMMEFIEAIPYKETQGYVTSIIRNYYWYTRMLGLDQPASLLYFWKPYKDLGKELGQPEPQSSVPSKPKLARVEDIEESGAEPVVVASPAAKPVASPITGAAPQANPSVAPVKEPEILPAVSPRPSSSSGVPTGVSPEASSSVGPSGTAGASVMPVSMPVTAPLPGSAPHGDASPSANPSSASGAANPSASSSPGVRGPDSLGPAIPYLGPYAPPALAAPTIPSQR
jgi:Transglycosylase SLT domain